MAPNSIASALPPHLVDCKWWKKGYCFRGAACYFRHDEALAGIDRDSPPETTTAPVIEAETVVETKSPANDPAKPAGTREPCAICLEVPGTYGLLCNCDHAFCLDCIRSWRSSSNESGANDDEDFPPLDPGTLSQTTKTCPLCRKPSDYIIPSSVFPTPPSPENTPMGPGVSGAEKNIEKEKIVERYLNKLENIPCRYFEEGVKRWRTAIAGLENSVAPPPKFKPRCFFANDCHYAHTDPVTGNRYTFSPEEAEQMKKDRRAARRRQIENSHLSVLPSDVDFLSETLSLNYEIDAARIYAHFADDSLEIAAIGRLLDGTADHMDVTVLIEDLLVPEFSLHQETESDSDDYYEIDSDDIG